MSRLNITNLKYATKSKKVNCLTCGREFWAEPNRIRDGRGKYCTKNCARKHMFTKEVRDKMSKAKLGKPAPWRQGNKCHFWKGGVTPINRAIRMSLEYKLWRQAVFERDKFTCLFCGKLRGRIEADHIKPFSLFPELRFAIDNGRTLCRECHHKTDTYGGKINKKL